MADIQIMLTGTVGQSMVTRLLAERTGTALDTVRADMGEGRILDSAEALAYGLVQEIEEDVFDPAQEIVNIVGTD